MFFSAIVLWFPNYMILVWARGPENRVAPSARSVQVKHLTLYVLMSFETQS